MALKTMPPLFQDVAVAAKTKRRERSWNANEQPFIQAFLFSPSSEKRTPSLIIIHDLFPWSLSSLKIAIKCSKEPFWSRTSTRSQTVYNNNKWNPIIQDFFLMIFLFYFHRFQKRIPSWIIVWIHELVPWSFSSLKIVKKVLKRAF